MSIVYRQELGRELTWSEADNNFAELKAGVDSKKSNFDVLPVTQGGTGQETVDAVKIAFDIATKTELASSAAGKGAELVEYQGATVEAALNERLPEIGTYALLRAYTGPVTAFFVRGVANILDGGFGVFRVDASDTTTADNGGTVLVDASGRRWKRVYDGAVNIKWFGAKGDGVTDDTAAFVAANTYLMTKPVPATNQVVESHYVTLEMQPDCIYKISGNRIFGSQIPTGSNGTTPPRMLQILGHGASLIWDVANEDDELFYFDGSITNPRVQGLSIFTTRSSIISTGAGVIFRFYSNASLSNQAAASKLHLSDVSVWPGRYTSGGSLQRPKFAILNTGNAMCDQMLIENCRFYYVQKVYVGQNDQAVNVTFSSCSFFGATAGVATQTTYFDFTRMNDNFNVVNCSFSVSGGETLIKTNSPTSGGYYVETSGYNFTFDNVRIEIIAGSTSWNLCDMNFGKLNLRNVNMALGNAASSVKTVVRLHQLANMNCENVRFNAADFYFPAASAASLSGALNPYGAYFNKCVFNSRATTTYAWTDGVTDYAIKDALISTTIYWRGVRFVDCNYLNQNGFYSWEFTNSKSDIPVAPRKMEKVTYSLGGIAFGKEFLLPPYQSIKKITLGMNGTLPDTFDTFRVWIGDRTLANTYDVDNIRPDIRKNEYVLFDGDATVFNSDQNLHSVEVALLSSGVESNSTLSWITVEYAPLDARAFNLTTTADAVRLYRKARNDMSGTTAQRPNTDLYVNQQYFDTTIGKPIWWNGSVWKDATGTTV